MQTEIEDADAEYRRITTRAIYLLLSGWTSIALGGWIIHLAIQ